VEKQILRNELEHEEMDRWRETASKVAIAALPIVGRTATRALVTWVLGYRFRFGDGGGQ